jgi:hypothetical protein
MSKFQSYGAGGDSAEMLLVALLLSNGACPNARASKPGSKLEGLTPLHILSCWDGGEVQAGSMRTVCSKPLRHMHACSCLQTIHLGPTQTQHQT